MQAMRRAVGLLVAMGAAVAVVIALVAFGVASVQSDIDERVGETLADAGYAEIEVDVDGRDVRLANVAADAVAEVTQLVDGVRGVRRVSVTDEVGVTDEASAPAQATPAPTAEPTTTATAEAEPDSAVVGPLGDATTAGALTELAGLRIGFSADSATLSADSLDQIDSVAAVLGAHGELAVLVLGSVSASEAPDLAERRATAVVDALVAAGVDSSRLSIGPASTDGANVTFVPRAGGTS
jgi:outer membrane protein OmpA-like peptidoglycan-associated protein